MDIIGISGAARSGKDTFANSLVQHFELQGVKAVRMALADELKREVRDFLLETLGIDSFTENDEEKQIIRPFLVFWGTEVRRKMDENCWIKALEKNAPTDAVIIVSDIRHPNEQQWVKENNGFSIFIDRMKDGFLIDGANENERTYNPILRDNSDHNFTWDTMINVDNGIKILDTIVDHIAYSNIPERLMTKWKQIYSLSKK